MNSDTIFALSSGATKSGVAVIRISGGNLSRFFGNELQPRHAYFKNLRDDDGKLIDQCIVVYFNAPHSFTGEDVIEIHSHGAPAVLEKIFKFLGGRGLRMAEPGEFTRRAFYNNKMDLTEVDGLAALLDARTDKQREFALKSMTGADSRIYETWRSKMIEISAYAAAILDYDENDLPKNIGEKLSESVRKLYDEISKAVDSYANVRAVRSGFNIVLTGETNVGKSSLFNAIVGESRAIVSDIPGTTRDVVSADIDIDGYLVHLSDTAGLRESNDEIEKIGIEKTFAAAKNADLILRIQSSEFKVQSSSIKDNEILVINKCDLLDNNSTPHTPHSTLVSATTGFGIPGLMESIKSKIHQIMDGTESDLVVNERTRELLTSAAHELKSAIYNTNMDMFAEHVRGACDNIGKILGVIDAAEIMDATFGQLCLGK